MSGATFKRADLTNANLSGADLVGVTFDGTIFSNTNLSGADMEGVQVKAPCKSIAADGKVTQITTLAQLFSVVLKNKGGEESED